MEATATAAMEEQDKKKKKKRQRKGYIFEVHIPKRKDAGFLCFRLAELKEESAAAASPAEGAGPGRLQRG